MMKPHTPGSLPESLWPVLAERAAGWVSLPADGLPRLQRYAELLVEWNRRFNLTAITEPSEVVTKHFLDSLSCAAACDLTTVRTLIDVGTGAGFPGLVLKIAFPHLQVTLLDSVEKRLRFLERVVADCGLTEVRTLHARAEDAAAAPGRKHGGPLPQGGPHREAFDLVTARAVAPLRVLAEWVLPCARVGGAVLAMKGPDPTDEIMAAQAAIHTLGGGPPEVTELTLPGSDVRRSLVLIPKLRPTPPPYPRAAGAARKEAL